MNIHGIQSVGTLTQEAGGFATLTGSFTGSFKGDGSQLTGLPSQSFDTSSLLSTASFNAYTQSTNVRLNNLESTTASLNTSVSNLNIATSSLNQFSASANQRLTAIESVSGSWITEAETASFAYINKDNNWSANQTFTNITAVSASFTYVQTVYETSSVIYSSGSNQLGDELTDVQTLSGSVFIVGSGSINGNRILTTADTASLTALSASYALTSSITRNVVVIARNNNASTLAAGTVVHITSAVGDNPVFTTASYNDEALSSNTFGLLRNSSPSGADVEVVVNGVVTGVNTDPALGYTAGDILYLSSSGQFTKVQPQAPNQIVTLGQVLRAQQNNGSIYVSINNGWELNELHNVQINTASLATGDFIVYESASYGLWVNKSATGAGLTTTSSFNAYTSSTNTRLNNLETTSASVNTSISNINTFTASVATSISNLNIATASLNTFSASALTSISNINTFTASANTSISNLNTATASINTSITNLNASSASQQVSIDNINLATGSLFTSASRAIVTASVNLNTITFTKGDTTTFALTVNTGSGGSGAGFPYTGDAVITGSLLVSGSTIPDVRVIGNIALTGSIYGQPVALSVVANTASIDMRTGNSFTLTLPSSSVTHIIPTNIIAGQTLNLLIRQQIGPATGSITFAPAVLFPSGLDMQATATGSAIDLVSMISFDTTNLMAANVKNLK